MFITSVQPYLYRNTIALGNKAVSKPAINSNVSFGSAAKLKNLNEVKEKYLVEGINYLFPNEIWTDSKIEKTISGLDKNIKKLIKNNKLTKNAINDEINKLLPKNKQNMVEVFDLEDLRTNLVNSGYSKEDANAITEICDGIQMPAGEKSQIFIPLSKYQANKNDKFTQLVLRMSLAHELTHSFQAKLQNHENDDNYHYRRLGLQRRYTINFFENFEEKFYPKFEGQDVYERDKNPSEDHFYKYINVKNEKELFKDFDEAMEELLKTKYQYYSRERYSSKQFFDFCKHKAHNERMAYRTSNIMKELHYGENETCFINYDYRSKLYEKMEKYFAQKAKTAEEFPEQTYNYKFKNFYG